MRKNIEENFSDIFVEVISQCFFTSWMFKDKLGEIQHFFFIEKEVAFTLFSKGDPLFCGAFHEDNGRTILLIIWQLLLIAQTYKR